jgi:hypothetical protein
MAPMRLRSSATNGSTARAKALDGPVRVSLQSKAECAGDSRLEEFRCGDGPAAHEIQMILENLHSGEALPQTVAMLSEESSGALLALASIRIDGNAQIRAKASTPWFLRRLSTNPYVNLLVRDERYRNHVLCDGQTRLGTAALRAGLEVVEAELPDRAIPTVWALIKRANETSKLTFREFAFYPHARSAENQQDVFVRRAGRSLPPLADPGAYISFERRIASRDLSA